MTARTTYLTRTANSSERADLGAAFAHQAATRVEEDQTDREFFILITPRRAITR